MLEVKADPGQKIIELGGGADPRFRPNCDVRHCFDKDGNRTTDFTADFNEPLPITSEEWDAVFCQYCLEHISWRKVKQFISEMYRILKPGGKVCVVTSNTEAQIEWIKTHPEGWDDKPFFESASGVLFGDMDYPENSHRCYFNPGILKALFMEAGFIEVIVQVYGARHTDLVVTGTRPRLTEQQLMEKGVPFTVAHATSDEAVRRHEELFVSPPPVQKQLSREEMFDRHYFNGGLKVGGYANEGYRDFPVHEVTFRHILTRRPKSVLEIGCARGYILKRLQDQGIRANGLEISKHCWLTRVCDGIINKDICETPWPFKNNEFDLCFSIATLEHIPEEHLDKVLAEMARVSSSGLHGIDFGDRDDGFDKTHCTLKPKEWWQEKFWKVMQNTPHPHTPYEILNKEELEHGPFPEAVARGDGKVKLNIGCGLNMFHYGWQNIDILELDQFAQQQGYNYLKHDVKNGLPQNTETVDLIFMQNFLEKLTYREGLAFLRECRRVLKPDGAMRIVYRNADYLSTLACDDEHSNKGMSQFDEISNGFAGPSTIAGRLWSLLYEGNNSCYDIETLEWQLKDAGFVSRTAPFRQLSGNSQHPKLQQILKETQETCLDGINTSCDVLPKTS